MTNNAITILPTLNEGWGFFGTIANIADNPREAWEIASRLIADATCCNPEGVRSFLDSRMGRHFADEVHNAMSGGLDLRAAIRSAIDLHQSWRIDRKTEREYGIPVGLPFLTGWVAFYEILADQETELVGTPTY